MATLGAPFEQILLLLLSAMDNNFLYNPFEDTVFQYDMNSLSFFDLTTEIIDNVVKTEYAPTSRIF